MTPLAPVITNAGLASLMASNNMGVEAQISHIALGDGGSDAGTGYTPLATMTALKRERLRVPVGGGARVAPAEIEVQALFDAGPSFWIREVGFVLDDGAMLAIWSDPAVPLGYKTEDVPLAVAYYLSLAAVPANSVTVLVTGPSVNLTISEPWTLLSSELLRLQRRIVESEVARLSPTIAKTWY